MGNGLVLAGPAVHRQTGLKRLFSSLSNAFSRKKKYEAAPEKIAILKLEIGAIANRHSCNGVEAELGAIAKKPPRKGAEGFVKFRHESYSEEEFSALAQEAKGAIEKRIRKGTVMHADESIDIGKNEVALRLSFFRRRSFLGQKEEWENGKKQH